MTSDRRARRPISARHAFALAFDLATRRDPVHSLLVPLLLSAPWLFALAMLSTIELSSNPGLLLLASATLLGERFVTLLIAAMLRFRARSVFNTPPGTRPAPALDCYAGGLTKLGWLFVTEIGRNLAIAFGFLFVFFPGLFLWFRLSFATEAVVLSDRDLSGAFSHSFKLTQGRLERVLEMIVISVLLTLSIWFLMTAIWLSLPSIRWYTWVVVIQFVTVPVFTIIQYAWSFFYLRLLEVEEPAFEVGPSYAAAIPPGRPEAPRAGDPEAARPWRRGSAVPHLTLVEPPRPDDDDDPATGGH